ncbi:MULTISPECIES: transposase [unclassified Bradyrhizobium]|uniref:transposase n=1 Tax=unclassified Bradyrhizobium TaxID=2631580 RepID=UPI001FF8C097|nr:MULTISPECIES: transposase [unclassified Bradyrhizobium]
MQDGTSGIKRHPDRRLDLHEWRHDELHRVDVHVQNAGPGCASQSLTAVSNWSALETVWPQRPSARATPAKFGFFNFVKVARQITEAFPWDEAPHYIIRDRDRIYGSIVTRRLRAMGIRDKPTAPASPWQNGFAERLIGSIRRECVDHIIVLGEVHLRQILQSYARYYNDIRTHRSLDKDAPVSRQIQRIGSIKSHAILGGLHHHYARA